MLWVTIYWCAAFTFLVAQTVSLIAEGVRSVSERFAEDEAVADYHDTLVWTSDGWVEPGDAEDEAA